MNYTSTFLISLQLVFMFSFSACAQTEIENKPVSEDIAFEQMLNRWIDFDVPLITCDSLKEALENEAVIILDAREKEEFEVSHLPNAIWIGYDDFSMERVQGLDPSKPVVVYCSVGYRSGKITKQMQKAGFLDIANLYGSIFEWKNLGYLVVNEDNQPTEQVHTYNKKWSQWLKRGEKVY